MQILNPMIFFRLRNSEGPHRTPLPRLFSATPSNIVVVNKKRRNWKPSREELVAAFIAIVTS